MLRGSVIACRWRGGCCSCGPFQTTVAHLKPELRRHDTDCSNSSCSRETLAAGLRPGARRARGLPNNRSRPVTNSAVAKRSPTSFG